MKVFEVTTEHCESGSKEIITTHQYITSEDDDILTVTEHFTRHCFDYEKDLKGIREIVIITEHVPRPKEGV